ncbi:MAG TPA: class I SAM-dependent methyltransferase, partial [Gemmataceae bacterium]|nr:class I SAM-dependent methyltransferase [Gemmataceae bacterium]
KRRYRPDDEDWIIEAGSVLDRDYLSSLGRFDFVYAWGVLHHTGALWQALEHASQLVAPRGRLWLAVYNDQGIRSVWWGYVKRLYQRLPGALRPILVFGGGVAMYGSALVPALVDGVLFLCALRNPFLPLIAWYRRSFCATLPRGMHLWTDLVDWVGGYPFEFARPEQVFSFFRDRGFVLQHLVTAGGGHGCNEFVFVKVDCASGPEVVGE